MLGWICRGEQNLHPVYLNLNDLRTHVAIFGMTGSGKSTTAGAIVSGLIDLGVNVLIIDWHNEYRSLILRKGGLVFTPGRDIAPLTLNPFDPSLSEDLSEHISLVTDIFSDIFAFTPPQAYMFKECLTRIYRRYGYFEGSSGPQPTLSTIIKEIEMLPVKSAYDVETKLALLRRLKPLTEGQAGKALDGPSTIPVKELLDNVVSVELGHFKEQEVRKIFTSIFLKLLYDWRTKEKVPGLKHVTVIEEAGNLVPARRPEAPPSIGERMISELRKYGEGLIIVAQFPTQISRLILKNAATRICHRIRDEDDRRVIQGALSLDEQQAMFLHHLGVGEAVVAIPASPYAFPVRVHPEALMFEAVSDEELASIMRERFYERFLEIEERSMEPEVRLKAQAKIYELIKRTGSVSERRLREEMSDLDFGEVLSILDSMIDRGWILREWDVKERQFIYKLRVPQSDLRP